MFTALRKRVRQGFLLGCVSGAALLVLAVGQASAATYPGGGSTFTGGAEGWKAGSECKVLNLLPLLCTGTAGYDEAVGTPPGSLEAKTEIPVNLIGLFKSTAQLESPSFTAEASGAGSVSLARQFDPGGLLTLGPEFSYTVYLVDKTTNARQKAFGETLTGVTSFAAKSGGVTLTAGHSYAIQIEATDLSTIAAVGLLGGEAVGRFDNVSVVGPDAPSTPGANGGANGGGNDNGGEGGAAGLGGANGKPGSGGVSDARLRGMVRSAGLVGAARLKGNRILVKAKCPAKIRATCTIRLQGLLSRKKPATAVRKAKVKKGKTKSFALKVKPRARRAVRSKRKLLFKETVKAGNAKATIYKRIKLVRKRK